MLSTLCLLCRGTPVCAAVEMLSASEKDPVDAYAADVWALGCMLFQLLVGGEEGCLFPSEHEVQLPLNKVCDECRVGGCLKVVQKPRGLRHRQIIKGVEEAGAENESIGALLVHFPYPPKLLFNRNQ